MNAAYSLLASGPLEDPAILVEHHDFLRWIGASPRADEVLEEALLDLLLLARARTVAGSLFGNMPRLALQWRVEPPYNASYISLDGYPWCTRTSCGCHPLCSTK